MSGTGPTVQPAVPDPEDAARAGWYGLIARLFYAPADAALLAAIASMDVPAGEESPFAVALRGLADAARAADPDQVREEYDGLFIGAGKAQVTLYLTHYLARTGREKLLVRVRDDLARLGLARKDGALEPEDHLAGLCDVMRHVIARGGEASLAEQHGLFSRYVARSFEPLCEAIDRAAPSGFHAAAARFACAFLRIESEAFSMGDGA